MEIQAITANIVRERFTEEQDYIQKYIEFVLHKTSIFESHRTEITRILSQYKLFEFHSTRPWSDWKQPYSYEELQELFQQLRKALPTIYSDLEETEKKLGAMKEPEELGTVDARSFQGECIQYMLDALEYDSSQANIEDACRELMEQIGEYNREISDTEPLVNIDKIVNYAVQGALYLLTSKRFHELRYAVEQINDIDIVLRMTMPESEINIRRQGFITLITIFDAAVFDLMKVALKKDFFSLIGILGQKDKISLEKFSEYGSFVKFQDTIIEDQLKTKYLKDILMILNSLGVNLVDLQAGDKFVHLIELVLRRNIHVHNKGRVDERYLERNPNGSPKCNIYNLSLDDIAIITPEYWDTANRLCRNCIIYISEWAKREN